MCRCCKNEFFNLTGNACFMQRIHMKCKCRREHFSYVLFVGNVRTGQNLAEKMLRLNQNVNAKIQGLKKFVAFVLLLDIF